MQTTHRYALPSPDPDAIEGLVARLWAAGTLGVEQRPDELVAWFPKPVDTVPEGGVWSIEEPQDWLALWKAGLEPVRVGDVVVAPTWVEDVPEAEHVIRLDPGQAFGTGSHATTRLCLLELQRLDVAGRRVADIGTGTGVLAIAAAKLGASEVVGVDIDPEAIAAARQNALANEVADLHLAVGSSGDLAGGPFDVVLANLLTDTLVALAPELAALTAGTIVASGIAVERAERVVTAFREVGLVVHARADDDGWAVLVASRA